MDTLLAAIREQADAIKRALREQAESPFPPGYGSPDEWPPECLDALRRYHGPPVLVAPHSLLFGLLGRRVRVPGGAGVLLQVFADRAAVRLYGEEAVRYVRPEEVRPDE